jgi:hypothetical protein
MKEPEIFGVGNLVEKVGGDYTLSGVVVAAFMKRSGARRYVVEDDRGILMIYSGKNLRLRNPLPLAEVLSNLREAGGHAWDAVDDPASLLGRD